MTEEVCVRKRIFSWTVLVPILGEMGRMLIGTTLIGILVVAGLIVGLAVNLRNTQEQARESLRESLDRRAALTARLIGSALMANNTAESVAKEFGGSRRSVAHAVESEGEQGEGEREYVLDSAGRVIAATPASLKRVRGLVERGRHLRVALAGTPAVSDAIRDQQGHTIIEIAVPFRARFGERRVLVGSGPIEIIENFTAGFFASASAIPGSRGYLLDGKGETLSSMASGDGSKTPDAGLRAALRRGPNGRDGDRTFVSAPVPSSRWRVVLSVPSKQLYAPVNGASRRAAWRLFAAFSLAICGLLAVGLFAVRGTRRLAVARESEHAARQLAHERLHDALTGLPNRTLFQDRVEHALATARRRDRSVAVIFTDIDRFKRINDSLGHEAGDAVLRQIAERLAASVRAEDTVSRFGGDEFVLLFEDVDAADPLRVLDHVKETLEAPVEVDGRRVPVTVSIGVAVNTAAEPPLTAADLIRDADTAMYRAKDRGGARIELFDAELHQSAIERLDAEVALRKAIDDEELAVFYQPIVTLPEGRLAGAEALVRWRRPETGEFVPPGEFIPLAEETGLIVDLGDWVLRTAIREVGDWSRQGLVDADFELSVNVSGIQLSDPSLPDTISEALAGWDLPAGHLCLEITETAVTAEPTAAELMLDRLHNLGVRLALDDFGVGHSSLGQLARSMPISTLKLDRSFVAGMTERRDRGIVQAAASLAQALTLSSIAEGVETPEQAAQLAAMGFSYAQGFHFGRPTDGKTFAEQLALDCAARRTRVSSRMESNGAGVAAALPRMQERGVA